MSLQNCPNIFLPKWFINWNWELGLGIKDSYFYSKKWETNKKQMKIVHMTCERVHMTRERVSYDMWACVSYAQEHKHRNSSALLRWGTTAYFIMMKIVCSIFFSSFSKDSNFDFIKLEHENCFHPLAEGNIRQFFCLKLPIRANCAFFF